MAGCIYLAEALGDSTWLEWYESSGRNGTAITTYGITCTVDMAAALEYREVLLTLTQHADSYTAYSRSFSAVSSEPCTPVPSFTSGDGPQSLNKLIALAAVATYQSVSTPWTDWARPFTMGQASARDPFVTFIRSAPYEFANSRNALEDVLALISALVLSRVTVTGSSGRIAYTGQKFMQFTRAGTGETWALVYILPSLFVVIIITALLVSSKGSKSGFSSEQLGDLVNLRVE